MNTLFWASTLGNGVKISAFCYKMDTQSPKKTLKIHQKHNKLTHLYHFSNECLLFL